MISYWNPIDRYGVRHFAADLAGADGAGAITPDLIPDEAGAWLAATDQHGLDRIFLVAPSSTDARITATAAASRGFVYAASSMGIWRVAPLGGGGDRSSAVRALAPGAAVCVRVDRGTSPGNDQARRSGVMSADGVIVGNAGASRSDSA